MSEVKATKLEESLNRHLIECAELSVKTDYKLKILTAVVLVDFLYNIGHTVPWAKLIAGVLL